MAYYVVSSGEGAQLLTTWAKAKEACRGRCSSCRSFPSKPEALRYLEGLRFEGAAPEAASCVHVDGAAALGRAAFAGIFFGPGDERNHAERLEAGPFTSVRAELLAACLGADAVPVGGAVFTDCELVCRAYRERFPATWANQDLLQRLALACERRGVSLRRVPGHAGHEGNEGAHRLCSDALQFWLQKENDVSEEQKGP